MANRAYEIAFELGAQIQSSFNSTFANANKQIGNLGGALGTAAKLSAGVAVAVGGAALATGGLAANISEDLQKSLNGLQAQTGSTDESMASMRESMIAIYNNNFGENFEDIGNSMTFVAKQTGLTGKELESATTNALMMRDTFDMEVNGSIMAVNQLMKQFGLTSEQSYNLMAQGAQNGMNAQDDLVDIIKEYSVQFKTMGFNGEEMFNMLSNGAKAGGFSVDVMGDAVKEFNIRSKDGSKATEGAFTSLGLNASSLTKAFASGGKGGKKAFATVSTALANCKDPILQNQIGTALWGTMWEDLGAKSILALGNTEGKINDSKNALAKINEVKYNTFGEAVIGIKRNFETGILIPLGDKVLPILGQFSTWVTDHMPQIKQIVTTAMNGVGNGISEIGGFINNVLMPAFNSLWSWVQPNMPAIQVAMQTAFDAIKTGIDGVSTAFGIVINWCVKYQNILIPLAAGITAGALVFGIYTLAIKAHTLATTIATTATTAYAAVLAFITSPIGIAVIAIGALIAVGVLLYKNWDTIKVVAMDVFGAIGGFISGVVDGISSAFRGMVNGVIGGLNSMIGALNGIHFSIPNWVPGLGGQSFGLNIPQIPQLANGGYIKHKPGGILANIGEGGEDEVVSPVSKLKNMLNPSPATNTNANKSEQVMQITYSPQIIIQGNADKAVVEEANQKGFDDFKAKFQDLQNRKQRLNFARG